MYIANVYNKYCYLILVCESKVLCIINFIYLIINIYVYYYRFVISKYYFILIYIYTPICYHIN